MKLQIEKAVYGGAGLAHQTEGEHRGQTMFVPFTLPGELVEARLLEQKAGFGDASLIDVITPSKNRVQPACAHFGQCGGCHYQHAEYSAQLEMKVAILHETLERAGLSALPAIQSHAGEPWAYRNRTRLRVEEVNSTPWVGYNRRGSNEFLGIHECPILAPLLWRGASSLQQIGAEASLAARWLRNALEIEFFATGDEKKLLMTVFVRKEQTGFGTFCARMKEFLPELVGANTSLLASTGLRQRTPPQRRAEIWGAEGLSYRAAGEEYWVSHGGFFQVNRSLIDELVQLVTTGRSGTIAWDLYAGVGLFSRVLTKSFRQVVAVESVAHDLSSSFKGIGRRAVEATTVEFLRSAVVQRERPGLIVMDPPRAGVGAEVCALLARIAAPEIIYVSCDPVTLARDLKSLIEAGYYVSELHMVDMFPQTFHLETVVVLRR
jgi:23S rRNA (uracil1939-C5)-methyltransferase